MKHKKLLFIGIGIGVAGIGALGYANYRQHGSPLPQPVYKDITSYGDGSYGYQCSRPIKAKLQRSNNGDIPDALVYRPVDPDEARLFCHATSAIEFKGIIKVLQKPEVLALISKYKFKDVSIKALEFKYIQDKDYVHRLLPAYQNREIGCIILLDTPGEDKVYLEDERLNTFEAMDYATFARGLEQISPADRKLFYDNLK